jgi:hypothetical protein
MKRRPLEGGMSGMRIIALVKRGGGPFYPGRFIFGGRVAHTVLSAAFDFFKI